MSGFRVSHPLRRIHRRSEVGNGTNTIQEGKTLFGDQIFQIKPQTQVSRKPIKSKQLTECTLISSHMYQLSLD